MCGIAGFVGKPDPTLLRQMCGSLIHRGPDDEGFFESEAVSLSMRRLAIIDLKMGHQPISNETGDVWVVFNGEIYNFEDLRERLIECGHQFRTHSDTETIVHAYEEYGLDFVNELRGMFAIAIWDSRCDRLVLVRDRIGEKPLFVCEDGGRLYFGSEIKAILQAVRPNGVDSQAVCDYLCAGYVTAPRTFYKGIRKLAPGERIVYENGRLVSDMYWSFSAQAKAVSDSPTFEQACDELDANLTEAVRLCLKSDVEVAAFLSGGVDSSLIVALMKKLSVDIQTFSVGYEGAAEGFNELNFAKIVSEHVGTKHHELILGAESNLQLLPKVIQHYDEPHGEPTSILVYLLCEFVQKQVKVALGGTGGDELFYGYPRHGGIRYLQYYQVLPKWLRGHVIERLAAKLPESTKGKNFLKRAKRFISGASAAPDVAYCSWVQLLQSDMLDALISDAVKSDAENPAGDSFLVEQLIHNDKHSLLDRVTNVDVGGYLSEYQLTYMDRMSMATSLEVRSPLCDFRLAEYAAQLPHEYRLKGGRSKHILKEVAKRYLPVEIVDRKKVGFDSPIGQWFKDELNPFLHSFLDEQHVAKTGLLAPQVVSGMVAEHCAGKRNYSLPLWSIVALEAWHRMYMEDDSMGAGEHNLADIRGAVASA